MSKKKAFDAVIEESGSGGAFVTVPFDVEQTFGSKRPKIKATIDKVLYRGSLVRMGAPHHFLIMRKDIREKIGKQPGDVVKVTVEPDEEPRTVTVPRDFARAMKAHPDVRKFFDGLSYTNRKEYVAWIEGAKRETTRASRIERAVVMLGEGRKAP